MRRASVALACLVALGATGLQAAEELPMRRIANMFEPLSTPAHIIMESAYVVLIITFVIFVVVAGLLAYACIKFRAKPGDDGKEPPQIYGSSQIEMAWTVIPILITVVLIIVTARTIGQIQNAPMPENAVEVRVVGHQWWWEIHYPGYGVVTANEIHIPVSRKDAPRPTFLLLQSADVIHSFWVPQLAGKTDLVPNRDNRMWLDPHETGVYFGNCAEYCGTQHANMLLRVIVEEEADFEAWIKQQNTPAVVDASVDQGRHDFSTTSCVNCHNIKGLEVPAIGSGTGVFGPDLTHLMSRQTIGAGVADMNPENLRDWIKDPQNLKPGCLMPDMRLGKPELDSIVEYLSTLK